MLGQTDTVARGYAGPLRRSLTDAERTLWRRLRGKQLGVTFRRQHPFLHYVLDFVCLDANLVVEVDGSQHMDSMCEGERDRALVEEGVRVLGLWKNEVLEKADEVL